MRGIARQTLARAQEAKPHRPAGGSEMARRDEAVAAIVAGAAQHRDRAHPPAPHHRGGDGLPRRLHQGDARHAPGDRGAVRRGHFRGRQQGEPVGVHAPEFIPRGAAMKAAPCLPVPAPQTVRNFYTTPRPTGEEPVNAPVFTVGIVLASLILA